MEAAQTMVHTFGYDFDAIMDEILKNHDGLVKKAWEKLNKPIDNDGYFNFDEVFADELAHCNGDPDDVTDGDLN